MDCYKKGDEFYVQRSRAPPKICRKNEFFMEGDQNETKE